MDVSNKDGVVGLGARLSEAGDIFLARMDAANTLSSLTDRPEIASVSWRKADVNWEILNPEQRSAVTTALKDMSEAILESMEDARSSGGDRVSPRAVSLEDPTASAEFMRFLMLTAHKVRMPELTEMLRRSVLILMVSDFESLVASTAKAVMKESAQAASLADATLTLGELEALDSVERARSIVVQRKVDELLHGGINDWASWFSRFGVNLRELASGWGELVEVLTRRHVHVHAGGTASEQYVERVSEAGGTPGAAAGRPLDLDETYLRRSIGHVTASGILLVGGTWLQLHKHDTAPAELWLVRAVRRLVELENYEAASMVCRRVLRSERGRWARSRSQTIQVTQWVADMQLGRHSEVQAAVEKWDVDGLDLKIAHAKNLLLQRDDPAVDDVRELLRRNDLTIVDLISDPMYKRLLQERWQEVLPDGIALPESMLTSVDAAVREIDEEEPETSSSGPT